MPDPLIAFGGVDVVAGGRRLLSDIQWRIMPGENWAVLGGNGSGKTTLLRLIRGDAWPHPDSRGRRVYTVNGQSSESPLALKGHVAMVSAEMQENYFRRGCNLTGGDVVRTGFRGTLWLYDRLTDAQEDRVQSLIACFDLVRLSRKPLIEMSTGEARRVLMARALVKRPRLLLLDEWLNGLDIQGRQILTDALEQIMAEGTQVILTTHHAREIPSAVKNVLRLRDGRIVSGEVVPQAKRSMAEACINNPGEELIALENCDVYLSRQKVLHGITWRMQEGENWAILGPNGSGKSTFLRVITGDEYPAFGGSVRRRGKPGPFSVADIKRGIGMVTIELQTAYRFALSGAEVAVSGFYASIGLYEEAADEQRDAARCWLRKLGLEHLAERDFSRMSYGERRRLLIARALVNDPRILVLDEPTAGLDAASREAVLQLIEDVSGSGVSLLMVTHLLDELPATVNRVLMLKEGSVYTQGDREHVLTDQNVAQLFDYNLSKSATPPDASAVKS